MSMERIIAESNKYPSYLKLYIPTIILIFIVKIFLKDLKS